MKKLKIPDIKIIGLMRSGEKNTLRFLEDVDLEKTLIHEVKPILSRLPDGDKHDTLFKFRTENDLYIYFVYRDNEKVTTLTVWHNDIKSLFSLEIDVYLNWDEKRFHLINEIWNQFVEHFNLRIRLMFINHSTAWNY